MHPSPHKHHFMDTFNDSYGLNKSQISSIYGITYGHNIKNIPTFQATRISITFVKLLEDTKKFFALKMPTLEAFSFTKHSLYSSHSFNPQNWGSES